MTNTLTTAQMDSLNDELSSFLRAYGLPTDQDMVDEAVHRVSEVLAGYRLPTCDYCDRVEDYSPELTWNGDTGCHVECERKAGE